jgi:flavin-dependent dehydrogenase
MKSMANIAVVGAGPAGSSAGYHLARHGHRVSLIDKQEFPRDKTCGDGLGYRAIPAMSSMGLYPPDIHRRAAQYVNVDGLFLSASNTNSHLYQDTDGRLGYCIPRLVLDNLLYEQAVEAGCMPVTRRITEHDGSFQGLQADFDYVIDARGVYAGEANAIATRNYWTIRTEDLPSQYRNKIHIYFDPELGMGYGWIFPVAWDGDTITLNVGIGLWLDDYRSQQLNIIQSFERFVQKNNSFSRLAQCAIKRDKTIGCHLATAKAGNRVAYSNVLKIGDAANMTDPITGEGIANALISGAHAAHAITLSRRSCGAAENWQMIYRAYFETPFRTGLKIRPLRRSSLANNILISLMRVSPRIAAHVSMAISGLFQYNELFSAIRHRP